MLWALGWSTVLAALVRFPAWVATVFGVALVLAHNASTACRALSLGAWGPLWSILHAPGIVVATYPPSLLFLAMTLGRRSWCSG
ncbi:MAG TPA: hypothetical protein VFS60_15455 [Thermoanaerobaculia bacterium]|nr:hypothetical protein [Thermoanaerobaculia bacterium]